MTTPDDITLPELPSAWIWKYANGEEEVVFVDASRMNFDPREEDVPTTVTSLYTADQLRTAVLEDRKRREAVKKDFCNTAKGQNVTDETERAYREAHGIAAQEGKTE